MSRIIRGGLIQASNALASDHALEQIKAAMVEKHEALIGQAASQGVQVLCLQELFYGPYFPAEQDARWYGLTEKVPGPTVERMQGLAAKYQMAMVIPVYEEDRTGLFYNTAAVVDADGKYLGKYRKTHIPHCLPGFWEKFYFTPGDLGYPAFDTAYARIGVYICYDRHFPEGARVLGLHGAEIVFIPAATVAGHADYLWDLEQRAHAVANGYFVGTINRVGREEPWNIGEFFGSSYFCNPDGKVLARGSCDQDELIIADLDLDQIREVRTHWQFYRDRRPEAYGEIADLRAGCRS
ncbi:MAG: acyltransferase [Acidobacteria bacterium]|nr:acyltransferase [Acidobacteriota bacterium]